MLGGIGGQKDGSPLIPHDRYNPEAPVASHLQGGDVCLAFNVPLQHPSLVAVLQLRGGKSKASAKKRAASVASKRKTVSHDDEDEDDDNAYDEDGNDDDEEEDYGYDDDEDDEDDDDDRRRRKSAPRKSDKGRGRSGKRGHSQLVPWGSGKGSKSKAGGILAGLVSQSRERLEDLAKQGQSAYKDVYRRAKVGVLKCLPAPPPTVSPLISPPPGACLPYRCCGRRPSRVCCCAPRGRATRRCPRTC